MYSPFTNNYISLRRIILSKFLLSLNPGNQKLEALKNRISQANVTNVTDTGIILVNISYVH